MLPESGGWDSAVAKALKGVEEKYFYGSADPNNRLENDDTLFRFLATVDLTQREIAATLSDEAYQLAAVMVPGGADWLKRTVVKTPETVNGKTKIKRVLTVEKVRGNIRVYLPLILDALRGLQLNDTDMLMMALGTVRAEASAFMPVDEGVSKYNTSAKGTPGHHAFDLYDDRADLGNEGGSDGALFKGRGFVQLTGKVNYISIGSKIGVNLLAHPDLANEPTNAAKILAQFLKAHEASIRAALGDNNLALARKKVNGGSHGLKEFVAAFEAGRRYLGIVVPTVAKANTNVVSKKR